MQQLIKAVGQWARENKKLVVIYKVLLNDYWRQVWTRKVNLRKSFKKNNYYLTLRRHRSGASEDWDDANRWQCLVGDVW
jgi:hypothetical protein